MVLARIAKVRVEREDLKRQSDLLRRKLAALERGGWDFDAPEGERPDPAALATELDAVTAQLNTLGADADVLQAHLEIVADVLGEASSQLRADISPLPRSEARGPGRRISSCG